ncbi:MAG: sulfate ABC transporter permease subunit CysT, partial [Thermoanaerobaculia bacterium]
MAGSRARPGRLPGFGLTMGLTVSYLSVMVLIPLSALILKAASTDARSFWATLTSPRVLAAYRLTLGTSLVAALVNAFFGLVVAWVLVRDRFPGRKVVDSLVDLPFALPTAVAGIVLTTLLAPSGWLGRPLAAVGVNVAFTPLGIMVALTFVGLP